LRCFDALAASAGVRYASALTALVFVGDAEMLGFTIASNHDREPL
jgi:hypothetical protein